MTVNEHVECRSASRVNSHGSVDRTPTTHTDELGGHRAQEEDWQLRKHFAKRGDSRRGAFVLAEALVPAPRYRRDQASSIPRHDAVSIVRVCR
jgi:hypothetical protein